mmetsp:Transcript_31204/g.92656  ORF Transcript_31204/g.92656 Transcript_31204/m.92656 type:complete len:374 (-) Transcript_31204:1464-2585(-)
MQRLLGHAAAESQLATLWKLIDALHKLLKVNLAIPVLVEEPDEVRMVEELVPELLPDALLEHAGLEGEVAVVVVHGVVACQAGAIDEAADHGAGRLHAGRRLQRQLREGRAHGLHDALEAVVALPGRVEEALQREEEHEHLPTPERDLLLFVEVDGPFLEHEEVRVAVEHLQPLPPDLAVVLPRRVEGDLGHEGLQGLYLRLLRGLLRRRLTHGRLHVRRGSRRGSPARGLRHLALRALEDRRLGTPFPLGRGAPGLLVLLLLLLLFLLAVLAGCLGRLLRLLDVLGRAVRLPQREHVRLLLLLLDPGQLEPSLVPRDLLALHAEVALLQGRGNLGFVELRRKPLRFELRHLRLRGQVQGHVERDVLVDREPV